MQPTKTMRMKSKKGEDVEYQKESWDQAFEEGLYYESGSSAKKKVVGGGGMIKEYASRGSVGSNEE